MAVHQYPKQLRINANIEVVMALNALQAYIRHKRDKEPDRPLGLPGLMVLTYSMPDNTSLVLIVTENKTNYTVRRGSANYQLTGRLRSYMINSSVERLDGGSDRSTSILRSWRKWQTRPPKSGWCTGNGTVEGSSPSDLTTARRVY